MTSLMTSPSLCTVWTELVSIPLLFVAYGGSYDSPRKKLEGTESCPPVFSLVGHMNLVCCIDEHNGRLSKLRGIRAQQLFVLFGLGRVRNGDRCSYESIRINDNHIQAVRPSVSLTFLVKSIEKSTTKRKTLHL